MIFILKKNVQFTARKILRLGVYLTLFCLAGCNACQSIEDLDRELNNGNDDPAVLILETWGTEVRLALEDPFIGWSDGCLGSDNFNGRLEIEVRTALIDDDGNIIPDPDPYYEDVITSVPYSHNNGISNNGVTLTTIEVPETGAYLLRYSLEVNRCTLCCHGESDDQCGTDQNAGKCQGGMPRVIYEEAFTSGNRPMPDLNHKITSTDYRIRSCVCPSTFCFTDC